MAADEAGASGVSSPVIAVIGDVVNDVVVRPHGPIAAGADTPAVIRRRRGGSAANTAAVVSALGARSRFIGRVGADVAGDALVRELEHGGVEVVGDRVGASGTIVVVLDDHGERSMLTDRGSCGDLEPVDPSWLDDVTALHVPWYSLADGRLAHTTSALVATAHGRGVRVSVDASSSSLIACRGAASVSAAIRAVGPQTVFCNAAEHAALGTPSPADLGATCLVVKWGADPACVMLADGRHLSIPAIAVERVLDTTGAGDAFAAGFLVAEGEAHTVERCVIAGHRAAASAIEVASRWTEG